MGIMPMVIPMFWKMWNKNMASTPTQISVPAVSRAEAAARQIRAHSTPNATSTAPPPNKPSCSHRAVKMKSLCCSGTKP